MDEDFERATTKLAFGVIMVIIVIIIYGGNIFKTCMTSDNFKCDVPSVKKNSIVFTLNNKLGYDINISQENLKISHPNKDCTNEDVYFCSLNTNTDSCRGTSIMLTNSAETVVVINCDNPRKAVDSSVTLQYLNANSLLSEREIVEISGRARN